MTPDPRSIEQRLVEELGAELVGTQVKLGEFLAEDGEHEGEELLVLCVEWLEDHMLVLDSDAWVWQNVEFLGADSAMEVHVRTTAGKRIEYQFVVQADGTMFPKRFHHVTVSVLVPVQDDVDTSEGGV